MDRAGFQFVLENTKSCASALLAHQSLTAWTITDVGLRSFWVNEPWAFWNLLFNVLPMATKSQELRSALNYGETHWVALYAAQRFAYGLWRFSKHFPVNWNQSWLRSKNLAGSRSPAISYMLCCAKFLFAYFIIHQIIFTYYSNDMLVFTKGI
jgi:hypothetical protein